MALFASSKRIPVSPVPAKRSPDLVPITPIAVASLLNETIEPSLVFLLNSATLFPSLVNLDLPELANSTPAVFKPELVFPTNKF